MLANNSFTSQATILIDAPGLRVWEALTKPELIKQYLFGTTVTTDWKVGSSIIYTGQWEGKTYQDKGMVKQLETGRLLVTTYWSSMSGLSDIPENYKTVRYELTSEANGTRLTIIQDKNASPDEASHSEQNWKMVLEGIKKLLEEG